MADPIRVLHVDDDREFAEMAAEFLEREDERFDVKTVTSAAGGLDRLAEGGVDCVVSDYQMPGRDGLQFLETVRKRHGDLPFVLFTGKGSEEIASEAISAGVSDYLQKGGPEQYALLANRVHNAVEGYRAERRAERRREQLREVIDSLPYPLCVTDGAERYLIVNEVLADFHDMGVEEIEGMRVQNILDPGEYGSFRSDVGQVLETGETKVVAEVEVTDAEGETRVLEPRMLPFDFPGTDEAVLSVTIDLTERRERERQLRVERDRFATLFENLPNPVVRGVLDDGRPIVEEVNPAFEETFGHGIDEIECRDIQELIRPDGVDDDPEALDRELLETGELHTTVRRRTVDGVRTFRVDVTLRNPGADTPEGYAIYTPIREADA